MIPKVGIYWFLTLTVGCLMVANSNGKNILGIFVTYSRSHQIVFMSVTKALVERGHNVTVITTLPLLDTNPKYRHIQLKQGLPSQELNKLAGRPQHPLVQIVLDAMFLKEASTAMSSILEDPALLNLLKEDNHFDLLLMGYGYNDFLLGIAAHYKCPIALIWIMQPTTHISVLMGNPLETAYVPVPVYTNSQEMTFMGRVMNFIVTGWERMAFGVFDWWMKSVYDAHFPAERYPSYWEMKRNISLVLFNHHFSEGPVRPLVPGVIEIGGIQVKEKSDPLPEKVAAFLDGASEHGFIYFSLGSNVRIDQLGDRAIQVLYKVFSQLPQRVVWKFDGAQQPGNSKNILFGKWLPQDDILAHRNIRLFITHGGKGGISESQYHGVPMIGMPIKSEQPTNVETFVRKGYGQSVDYTTMTEESLKRTILEVLNNPKYTVAVRQFSKMYRDRPTSAKQTAVFWLEYVMRHKGAPHMQSVLMRMQFIQQQNIDVMLFIGCALYFVWKILKTLNNFAWSVFQIKHKVD